MECHLTPSNRSQDPRQEPRQGGEESRPHVDPSHLPLRQQQFTRGCRLKEGDGWDATLPWLQPWSNISVNNRSQDYHVEVGERWGATSPPVTGHRVPTRSPAEEGEGRDNTSPWQGPRSVIGVRNRSRDSQVKEGEGRNNTPTSVTVYRIPARSRGEEGKENRPRVDPIHLPSPAPAVTAHRRFPPGGGRAVDRHLTHSNSLQDSR